MSEDDPKRVVRTEREARLLAACSCAALGYLKRDEKIHPDFHSAALEDIFRLHERSDRYRALLERIVGGLLLTIDLEDPTSPTVMDGLVEVLTDYVPNPAVSGAVESTQKLRDALAALKDARKELGR